MDKLKDLAEKIKVAKPDSIEAVVAILKEHNVKVEGLTDKDGAVSEAAPEPKIESEEMEEEVTSDEAGFEKALMKSIDKNVPANFE